jgi:hypothetical protein
MSLPVLEVSISSDSDGISNQTVKNKKYRKKISIASKSIIVKGYENQRNGDKQAYLDRVKRETGLHVTSSNISKWKRTLDQCGNK